MDKTLGIYIHIPFCASKCGYCDFYSLAGCDRLMPKYQDALVEHIRESYGAMKSYYIDTVYFGGGTPSYYGADRLIELWDELRGSGRVLKSSEVTVEANPDSANFKELEKLRKAGFNRVSLGVQSANNDILKLIGRRHNWKQVEMAVRAARDAGFDNLSLDLIYGLPSQTKSDWADTLMKAIELRPEHISCYGLKVEEGTPLWQYKDAVNLPDDDAQADMYLSAVRILKEHGYAQYEISNFARRGLRSRHNLKYWTGGEYLGFGPAASSDFGGKRFTIAPDIYKYMDGVKHGGPILSECQEVPARERAGEYLMLRLRTSEGIDGETYMRQYLLPFAPLEELLQQYQAQGLATLEGGRWRLTPRGFLMSNSILVELLEVQEHTAPLAKRR